jgi:hypothetical protein
MMIRASRLMDDTQLKQRFLLMNRRVLGVF